MPFRHTAMFTVTPRPHSTQTANTSPPSATREEGAIHDQQKMPAECSPCSPSQRHVHIVRDMTALWQNIMHGFTQESSIYNFRTESIAADVRHFLPGKESFRHLERASTMYLFLGTLRSLKSLFPAQHSKQSETLYVGPNKVQHHACAGHHRRQHLCE